MRRQPQRLAYKKQLLPFLPLKRRRQNLIVLTCLLIGLLAAAPLWGPGIINTRGGGDSPFLLQRTLDMAENIKYGALPPRWMAHAAYDYGYPFFNHYGALPYYISGGLTLIGFPVTLAIQSTQTLGFVLAAFAMAIWTKQLYKNYWSVVLSVAAYTFAPFHLVNVYVRGDSLSEFYAFIWFPLILWALHRYLSKPSWMRLLTAAGTYGGLILTHNTSTVAFSPFALLYALIITIKLRGLPQNFNLMPLLKQYFFPLISPFLIGMLLTAWFWLPALAETGYGQLGSDFTEGYFHHSKHYRGLNLVQSSLTFDYSIAAQIDDAGPFSMGMVQALLAICGVPVLLLSKREDSWLQAYLCAGLALSTFIMTPLSSFLWDNLPPLSIMQFPWRFLAVQAVYTAAITAAIPSIIPQKASVHSTGGQDKPVLSEIIRPTVSVIAIILIVCTTLLQLRPDRLLINSDDVTWDILGLYETFTGNIGTTIRHEYLPKDVIPRPYITQAILDGEILPKVDGPGTIKAKLVEQRPNMQRWQINVAGNTQVADVTRVIFPLYWWPGWQAEIDGSNITTHVLPGSGQLAIDIPEGSHLIILRLTPTPLQAVALATSAAMLTLVIVSLIQDSKRSLKLGQKPIFMSLVIISVSLLLPAVWHFPIPETESFFDFDQMPYPHAGPIDFEYASLNHSNISVNTTAPGEEIEIGMQWSLATTEPLTATLLLVSPASHRHNVPYTLMETEITLSSEVNVKLRLPDMLSRGIYLVQLRVFIDNRELRAKTSRGHGMGVLFLGAVRVPEGTKSGTFPEPLVKLGELNLQSISADQTKVDSVHLDMVWTTPGTPRNWNLSIRLIDKSGQQIVQRDTQPGYGFLPTSLWHSDEFIYDYLQLDIPEGLAPGNYQVRIITYLPATMEVGGEIDIPVQIEIPTLYDMSNSCCEQTRKGATIQCQLDGVALLGVDSSDTVVEGQDLTLKTEWNAVLSPTSDISTRWVLINSENEVMYEVERPVAIGSDTTSWPRYTWVLNPVQLNIEPSLPPGTYELHLTMLDRTQAKEQCFIKEIVVQSKPRVYSMPSISHEEQIVFNDEIKLLGYDLEVKRRQKLAVLTIWWQAEKVPQLDYKRFVHLYDPSENVVVTQDDAMPRNWTYPTSWWDTGEIISETITLSLENVTKGTYSLATGWYDPETLDRLKITSGENGTFDDGRVTLASPVKVR